MRARTDCRPRENGRKGRSGRRVARGRAWEVLPRSTQAGDNFAEGDGGN
jgi:hypothetical protein